MLINFDKTELFSIPNLNNGIGQIDAKMLVQPNVKIMLAKIPPGSSIGMHRHTDSDDINYVLSGIGRAVCAENKIKFISLVASL